MVEADIVRDCLKYLALKGITAWRQNTAGIYNAKTQAYFFHGMRGVSDILGIFPQKCPCALQGLLLAVEVKRPGQHPTNEQKAFLKKVNEQGGIGLCVHSVDELDQELSRFL